MKKVLAFVLFLNLGNFWSLFCEKTEIQLVNRTDNKLQLTINFNPIGNKRKTIKPNKILKFKLPEKIKKKEIIGISNIQIQAKINKNRYDKLFNVDFSKPTGMILKCNPALESLPMIFYIVEDVIVDDIVGDIVIHEKGLHIEYSDWLDQKIVVNPIESSKERRRKKRSESKVRKQEIEKLKRERLEREKYEKRRQEILKRKIPRDEMLRLLEELEKEQQRQKHEVDIFDVF